MAYREQNLSLNSLYTPATPGEWSPVPTNVDDALNTISEKLDSRQFGLELNHSKRVATVARTGTTTFLEYLKLTTTSIPAGTYYIGWTYLWKHSNTGSLFKGRVQIDDSAILPDIHFVSSSPNTADAIEERGAFTFVALTAGVHTIDFDFGTSNGSHTATVTQCVLGAYKVSL